VLMGTSTSFGMARPLTLRDRCVSSAKHMQTGEQCAVKKVRPVDIAQPSAKELPRSFVQPESSRH
jgi:hypothetical protein